MDYNPWYLNQKRNGAFLGRRAGDAAGALVILRGMSKAGVLPGEYAIASTIEAFALQGDVDQVLALMEVLIFYFVKQGTYVYTHYTVDVRACRADAIYNKWGCVAEEYEEQMSRRFPPPISTEVALETSPKN